MRAVALIAALVLLAACEPRQLYLGSRTVVGVNASVSPEQTTGSLLIGYDRDFAAVIPRSVDTLSAGSSASDAMSALVCSNLTVDGITVRRFIESIATGSAARTFAAKVSGGFGATRVQDQQSLKNFFDCFQDPAPLQQNGAGR